MNTYGDAIAKKEIRLPAKLYDKLERSAKKFGGIGRISLVKDDKCHCIWGHIYYVHTKKLPDSDSAYDIIRDTMNPFIEYQINDSILYSELTMDGTFGEAAKVSWKRYCEIFNIKRGVK